MTVTEKKEILKQFAQLDLFINSLLDDQKHLTCLLETSASIMDSAQKSGTSNNKIKQCIQKIDILNQKTEQQIDKLCDLKERILDAVSRLENVTERSILWLHYIGKLQNGRYKRLALWQIAAQLNYSEIWIKQLHKTALEKLKI